MVTPIEIAKESLKKGLKSPKITVIKKVEVPKEIPRFVQYHVKYEGQTTEHVVVFPIGMLKDDKEAIQHITLMEVYRRSRGK